MSTLENLARYESPHSGLAFREAIYGPGDDAEIVVDCLALANAELKGRRFLFIGIAEDGATRELVGVDKTELNRFRRRFRKLVAEFVEPQLDATVRAVEIDDRLIGYIRIKNCSAAPYLSKQALGETLPGGVGYIRRGINNQPLQRSDMQRMFERNQEVVVATPSIRIGFPGVEPAKSLTLPALPLNKLPSELAAERLKSLLEANDQARDVFGRTETQFSRLMHAKLYGMDVPFRKRGDDSLIAALETVDVDYAAADKHYVYEVRSHELNLMVANDGESNLHDTRLRLTMPCMNGAGISDRVYTGDDMELAPDGYPSVVLEPRAVLLEATLGTLYAMRSVRAFREPARFWVREEVVGKAIPVDYELTAEELAQPIKGSLVIYVDKASLKSV